MRSNLTDSERLLWSRLRNKQVLSTQFYRQKPLGKYVVDFFAPKAKLVIEVDGSQHAEQDHLERDRSRDEYLTNLGLKVLRFNSREILVETDSAVDVILRTITERLNEIPSASPL